MNRKTLFLPLFLLFFSFNLFFGCSKDRRPPAVYESQKPKEMIVSVCNTCHDAVNEVLPDDHVTVKSDTFTNCIDCHSEVNEKKGRPFDLIIHQGHYATEGTVDNCWACHQVDVNGKFGVAGIESKIGQVVDKSIVEKMTAYFRSWASSVFLDQKHAENDVSCRSCHGIDFPDSRAHMNQCLSCHSSYTDIAELTRDVEPNPHLSHYEELRCTLCHKSHEASVLYCDACHEYDLKVP